MEDINKLKVTELRHELQILGLDTKGLKPVLIDRLRKAMEENSDVSGVVAAEIEHEDISEDVEEQEEESVQESDNKIETVAEITPQKRSPRKIGSPHYSEPATMRSPRRDTSVVESPKKLETALVEETPVQIESPQKVESPEKITKNVESPEKTSQKMESTQNTPQKMESPQKTPQIVESPEKVSQADDTIEEIEVAEIEQQEATKLEEDKDEVELAENDIPASNGILDATTDDAEMETSATDAEAVKEEIKEEAADDDRNDRRQRRKGEKRGRSPGGDSFKRHRPDIEEVKQESEPEFDKTLVVLDWYSSDLSLIIDGNRLGATPLHKDGFGYLWHAAKGTYGVNKGRVCYEVKIIDNMDVSHLEGEEHPHVVRVGWSFDLAGLILGEEKNTWGFGGTGKASHESKFKSYGKTFGKDDVIGCFLDLESEPSTISYTINGEQFGTCFEMLREDIQDAAIFPHIMTKNCSFKVNFGTEEPAFEILEGYEFLGKIPLEDRMIGTSGPEKKGDAEVIMMVGLPAAGKTTWAENYVKENPQKKYNILGTNNLIDRMKVLGLPRRRNYAGRWEFLIEKCTKALNKILNIANKRCRNYIIDQTNVYPSAQRRKMHGFQGFQRRAVVICPTDEELKRRAEKRDSEEGKDVPERAVLEMKGNFKFPEVGETFDAVDFMELSKEEGEELIQKYNKDGEAAGFGQRRNSRGGHRRGGGGGGGDRRGYNRGGGGGGGYRGNWDRERDRKGSFDNRRDRGNWQRDNRNDYRSGGGGGGNYRDNRNNSGGYKDRTSNYSRDNRNNRNSGGWQSSGGGSGYRNQNQGGSGGGYSNQGGWNNQQQTWGNQGSGNSSSSSTGWGGSNTSGSTGWGGSSGQNYNSSGYNWNQQYYGQQQQQQTQQQSQQQTTQQTPQQYWTNQGYGSQSGYVGSYGTGTTGGYNYSQPQVNTQAQQWQQGSYGTGYNQNYSTAQGTGSQSSYNRK